MSEAPGPDLPKAPLGRGARVLRAVAWTYAPQLAALVLSPVTECSHCVATFWSLFAILPGFMLLLLLGSSLGWFCWVLTGALTFGLGAAHFALGGSRSRLVRVVQVLLALLTALNAIAFGNVIRM